MSDRPTPQQTEIVYAGITLLWARLKISASYRYDFIHWLLGATIAASFVLLHMHILTRNSYYREQQESSQQLLELRSVPYRANEFPVATSAAIVSTSGAEFECSGPHCELEDLIHRAAAKAAKFSEYQLSNSGVDVVLEYDVLMSGIRREYEAHGVEVTHGWEYGLRFGLGLLLDAEYRRWQDKDLAPCSRNVSEHEREFGRALCDRGDSMRKTRLLVPARLAGLADSREATKQHMLRSLRASMIAESLIAPIAESLGEAESPDLVNAYFISPFGHIRIWSHVKIDPFSMLQPIRLWSESAYIYEVLKGANETETVPYLDLGASGLVRTRCTAIRSSTELLGAICTDIKAPVDLQKSSNDNKVWKTLPVRVSLDQRSVPSVEILADPDGDEYRSFVEDIPEFENPKLLRARVKSQIAELARESPSEAFSRVSEIDTTTERFLFVPLTSRNRRSGQSWDGLLIRIHTSKPSDVWLYGSAVFGALTTALLLMLLRWRLTRDGARLRDALLQNLQVGVIRVEEDLIRGANDRAEEILSSVLPTLGIEECDWARPQPLNALVHPTAMVRGSDGDFQPFSRDDIDAMRERGEANHYYLKLTKPMLNSEPGMHDQWIEVRGTPFIDEVSAAEHLLSFGILDTVTKELGEELDNGWKGTQS